MEKMRKKLTTLFTLATGLAGLLTAGGSSAQEAPLTIKAAVTRALENNYSLKADSLNLVTAASQARTAKADLLPQVNYSTKVEYNPAIPSQMLPGSIAGQPGKDYVPVQFGTRYNLSNGIEVSQTLVKKSTRLQVGLAELNTGIARTKHRLTKEDLVYQVAISFYTLQTNAEMIRTTEHDYRNLEKILSASKAQYEQGTLKKIDYQSLEINVRNKLSYLQQLQSQYTEQLAGFNYLLGIPAGNLTVIDENRSRTTDSIVAGNLLTQREDLHLSRQLIESKELEIKSIKAEFLPSLNSWFRFGYQAQLGNLDKTFNNDYWFKSSTIGISTSIPIFDGFRRKSRVSTATIQLKQLKLQQEDKQQLAQMEWIRENEKLNNNKMQFLITRQNLELAEKVFTSRMALYTEGITSLIELLDAEKDLTRARDLYTQSEINVHTGITGVHKAKGTLLTEFMQSL
jgi:outer membrane protein TolC